ncbi:MAG TPA: hypothetical protein GXX24_13355, partial [Paracoccus solventivorans]|nr:hypothetical protein [Paracoccus solventivorans]
MERLPPDRPAEPAGRASPGGSPGPAPLQAHVLAARTVVFGGTALITAIGCWQMLV